MKQFLELLTPPGDKVSLGEMAELKKLLPDRVKTSIPSCMYMEVGTKKEDGTEVEGVEFDYDVLILLAWIIARRENSDIKREEVGQLIGINDAEKLTEIEKRIIYFYTRQTWDQIEKHFADVEERSQKAQELAAKGATAEEIAAAGNFPESAETKV